MPSVILSDNGVSSGSAGLKSTAASDGVLVLQTTTSGGTATNAVYVDTSQLVGLGTTPAAKLHLLTTGNTTADGVRLTLGSEGRSHNIYSALATGRDLTIAPYRSLTINTGSGTNEGIVTLNSYEYTVFGTGSSYTERMRLDASGNLAIGTTSAGGIRLRVLNQTSISGRVQVAYIGGASSWSTNGAEELGLGFSGIRSVYTGSDNWALAFTTGTSAQYSAGTQPEVARIDSSGLLHVGETAHTDGSMFYNGSNSVLNAYRGSATANEGLMGIYSNFGSTKSVRAYFRVDGGLANYSANNLNLSDERLKKDITLAENYLAKICAIPVKNFRYKDQTESEDITLGVIAQDVLAVAPELVSQEGFGMDEESKQNYLSVYQTDLQYALMKCIQELKAELDTAKEQIAILQGAK